MRRKEAQVFNAIENPVLVYHFIYHLSFYLSFIISWLVYQKITYRDGFTVDQSIANPSA